MICVSLAEESFAACLEALKAVDFAEIRLDAMPSLTLNDLGRLFSQPLKLIATCRPCELLRNDDRKKMLIAAIRAGAAYVDVEIESEPAYRDEIAREARKHGCQIIVSFHDYEKTPRRQQLETIVVSCFEAGADIAKIACTVHSNRDCARLLGLLDSHHQVVAIGMGEKGRLTRIAAPLLGSPFTFASLSKGKETAAGQIDKETLQRIWEVLSHR
jgi:3-dehydroquinate dehydratase I